MTTDQFLLYSDLTADHGGMPPVRANLSKNATIPSVIGGTLWEDTVNKRVYSYGGAYPDDSDTAADFVLYGYDILHDQWDSFGPPRSGGGDINPTSFGAGVSVSWRGEAYHYGGWLSGGSSNSGEEEGGRRLVASDRLVKYDMDSNTFSNLTGPDGVGRAEGTMVYIPIGDGGMLVYFGGVRESGDGNGTMEAQPLDEILLYDIGNTKWYKQGTSGQTPGDRRLFCGGATWAKDQSSYNMSVAPRYPSPPPLDEDTDKAQMHLRRRQRPSLLP